MHFICLGSESPNIRPPPSFFISAEGCFTSVNHVDLSYLFFPSHVKDTISKNQLAFVIFTAAATVRLVSTLICLPETVCASVTSREDRPSTLFHVRLGPPASIWTGGARSNPSEPCSEITLVWM